MAGLEEGYSPLAKIFRLDAYKRAWRALRLKCEPPCLLGKRFSIQRALSSRIVEMCSRHSLASFLVALLTSFVKNSYQLFFAPHPLWPHTNLIQKIEKHQPKSWCFLAQAEGFEPPCRLGKRFSRPPRCDHFDKPAYFLKVKRLKTLDTSGFSASFIFC